MKRILSLLLLAFASLSFVAVDAEAARLGGGRTSGMKRQTPPQQPAQPAKPAATPDNAGATAAAATANPARRSWLGPVAGLAAGLGLAALFSHLGLGEELASFVMLFLLVILAVIAVRFLLRRFGAGAAQRNARSSPAGLQYAGGALPGATTAGAQRQGPGFGSGSAWNDRSATGFATQQAAAPNRLPADFDASGFERIAKLIFIRMQAANDAGDLEDLRRFATPEMFAAFKLDLQERKGAAQQTDVVLLNAQVLDVVEERQNQIVSVRFHGLIREDKDAPTTPFDEIWHLVKPTDGSREWAIAGIAQNASS